VIERLRRWLQPPDLGNAELNRRAFLLYPILIVLIPCTIGFVLVLVLLAPENLLGRNVALTALGIELAAMWLLRRGHVLTAGIGMIFGLWAALTTSIYLGDGVRSVSDLGQILVILMAGLLVSAPFALAVTLLIIVAHYIIMVLHGINPHPLSMFLTNSAAVWAVQSLFFLVAMGLTQAYVRSLRRSFDQAQRKEDSLTERVTELRQAQAQLEMNDQKLRRREAILETVSIAAERLFRGHSFTDSLTLVIRDLGTATGVDRVRIFENERNSTGELMSHEIYSWSNEGVPERLQLGRFKSTHFREAGLQRWVEVLSRNLAVKAHVRDLPDGERRHLQTQGLKSILIVPIFVGDDWWGFIGFDDVKWEREWSPEEEDALRGAAGILGGAIQRQRAERALNRSEQHYLAILQDQTDMICRYVPEGQITFANEAFERFFGIPQGQGVRRSIWDQMQSDDDIQSLRAKIDTINVTRPHSTSRSRNVRADGAVRWVEWTDRGIFDENGVLVELQAVGRDVDKEVHLREQLERNLRETETQAMTDPLTGLLNRRAISERASAEWERAQRDNRPLSVVLMDVDRLKQINDTYGHLAGDEALKAMGELLMTSMRRNDSAGRWGGDEFMLLLPGADLSAARDVAERLLQRFNRQKIRVDGRREVDLQVSLGVAAQTEMRGEHDSLDRLFSRADQALYSAKQRGRNQVSLA
jgi:diguanylate cyclase (GGDEF)-like protein/PAS domain S-box-containing protein